MVTLSNAMEEHACKAGYWLALLGSVRQSQNRTTFAAKKSIMLNWNSAATRVSFNMPGMSIQQCWSSLAFGCSLLQYLIDLVLTIHYNLLQALYDTCTLQSWSVCYNIHELHNWFTQHEILNHFIQTSTLCLKNVPTFKLSVTLSNLNQFSKFLHCWKAYEICYTTLGN